MCAAGPPTRHAVTQTHAQTHAVGRGVTVTAASQPGVATKTMDKGDNKICLTARLSIDGPINHHLPFHALLDGAGKGVRETSDRLQDLLCAASPHLKASDRYRPLQTDGLTHIHTGAPIDHGWVK
jgi:hypothetical protein